MPEKAHKHLARNQYINNSPGIFSCIRAGADTCAACICTEINSPKNLFYVLAPGMCEYRHYINTEGRGQSANTYFKNSSSKIFFCIRTHANTGPTCIRAKINSSRIFSCMYRFCAGGVNIWHMNNLSVTPVTEPPDRVPRRTCLCSLGFRTQYINI